MKPLKTQASVVYLFVVDLDEVHKPICVATPADIYHYFNLKCSVSDRCGCKVLEIEARQSSY